MTSLSVILSSCSSCTSTRYHWVSVILPFCSSSIWRHDDAVFPLWDIFFDPLQNSRLCIKIVYSNVEKALKKDTQIAASFFKCNPIQTIVILWKHYASFNTYSVLLATINTLWGPSLAARFNRKHTDSKSTPNSTIPSLDLTKKSLWCAAFRRPMHMCKGPLYVEK